MKHREGFFKGAGDVDVYYQCWLPEEPPKALLLIVHGLAEHSGRYMNVVNHFVPLGYGVYGIDHVGHGKSAGKRVYVTRFQDFTDTLKTYFDMIRKWHAEEQVFLVGHSMGGLIVAVYLLDRQAELAGAVLSGPSVKVPDNISLAVVFVGRVLSALMPKFGLIQLEAEGVSSDPAVVQAYISDPLVYTGKTTARLAAEMLQAMKRVSSEGTGITLPILIIQGGADRLVDPEGARMLYDLVQSADKAIKVYDGFYHEVFNEPEHRQVMKDVEVWLEAHPGSPKGV